MVEDIAVSSRGRQAANLVNLSFVCGPASLPRSECGPMTSMDDKTQEATPRFCYCVRVVDRMLCLIESCVSGQWSRINSRIHPHLPQRTGQLANARASTSVIVLSG